MNDVLGGTFTSRINMNLREDKHWSYGARSSLADARGQRPWLLSAPVQTDKTVDAMREIQREMDRVRRHAPGHARGDRQDPQSRRARAVRALTRPTRRSAAQSPRWSRSAGPTTTCARSRHASRRRATTACGPRRSEALDPSRLTWVVIGDLAKIEQPIRDLELGEVQVLDADGNALR